MYIFFFFSSRRRHTRFDCDWSSDVCSSDLDAGCNIGHRNATDGSPRARATSPTFSHATHIRVGARPPRVEHLPAPPVDRADVAGAFVPTLGGCCATKGSHRALRGRCEGSCARVRLVCCAHVGGVSRGRAQSEFLPLDPPDIPPSEVILVAEGIRSLLRLQAMRGQSHWIHPEPGGPPSPRP